MRTEGDALWPDRGGSGRSEKLEASRPASRQAGLKIGWLSNKEGVACCHEFGCKELTRD